MPLLAIDLGGTKLALALISAAGEISSRQVVALNGRSGNEVGSLIVQHILNYLKTKNIKGIGVAVPGIFTKKEGTVWAPNIAGWEAYPLLQEIQEAAGDIPVAIDSDRACYIAGEVGYGNAQGCRDAIFLAVGTGIGAGIITDGIILRGANDIAGAIGWMALNTPFREKYISCGCFEHHASGEGIRKAAREKLEEKKQYHGNLRNKPVQEITAHDVFKAFENGDEIAQEVLANCIKYWGMAVANLISIFNPEKIILGGGIFGPASQFINDIITEAKKWAQPISMQKVKIETSALGGDAGLYGAGYLALKNTAMKNIKDAL
jgi:glucokinase